MKEHSIHLPGTTTSIPYSVTLIFRRSDFHPALGSAYLYLLMYPVITMFTENSFVSKFDMDITRSL